MSDTEIIAERDRTTGRFLAGNSGNGGRKPGSRNKLGEQFVADLRDAWLEHGIEALKRCATEEPAAFVKVVAGLLPRDVSLSIDVVDPAEFATKFRTAVALLGNSPDDARPMRVINGRHR
jgi:hypothetical protein